MSDPQATRGVSPLAAQVVVSHVRPPGACPRCGSEAGREVVAVVSRGGFLWQCPACGGVWIGRWERSES